MAPTVRAIYERGQLRLRDDVELSEGQQVQLNILSERELVIAALGDLVVKYPSAPTEDDSIDEEALLAEIEAAFEGLPPLSETIIPERREGP